MVSNNADESGREPALMQVRGVTPSIRTGSASLGHSAVGLPIGNNDYTARVAVTHHDGCVTR